MGIDASIYSNIRPTQINMPSPIDAAEGAIRLSSLGMQQAQMGYQMGQTMAVRKAMADNTDDKGNLNQGGFLSQVGKTAPMAAMEYKQQFAKMGKEQGDAQQSQMDALGKVVGQTLPAMQYLAGLKEDERAKAYPTIMKQLSSQGVPMQNVPQDSQGNFLYDPGHFQQSLGILGKTDAYLKQQDSMAGIAEKWSNVNTAPAKLNADLYGTRSPNNVLTSQYDKQAAPIRSSQMAMQQMIDNYNHPSPQGDASLILNAFKIKFPTAPDVNSLEELSESQSTPDRWKQFANKAINGGLDKATRDNLMRDGVSTFRANVDSLHGIQERYNARAKQQNVNDPTITYEPAIDKTYASAMGLQKQIGPYVPPIDRGGMLSRLFGSANEQTANAAGTKVTSGAIRMIGPDGQARMIPPEMVGEAIAAGGRRAK